MGMEVYQKATTKHVSTTMASQRRAPMTISGEAKSTLHETSSDNIDDMFHSKRKNGIHRTRRRTLAFCRAVHWSRKACILVFALCYLSTLRKSDKESQVWIFQLFLPLFPSATEKCDWMHRPQHVQLVSSDASNITILSRLDDNVTSRKRIIRWAMNSVVKFLQFPDNILTRDTCELVGVWQTMHHPTCNEIHGLDLMLFYTSENMENVRLVNSGAFRDVWMVRESTGSMRALKTLRYHDKRQFDFKNLDRHRRDAVAYDQLTKSPYIADIYGHCAHSATFEFGVEGDLFQVFDTNPSKKELLEVAFRVAQSISDAHNIIDGKPSIAHTDLKPNQWISLHGKYMLNDFNRARLLSWDVKAKEPCGFKVGKNSGIWRSPEEYRYDEENEKVDVWTLGNVLYFLLMREPPWLDVSPNQVHEQVMQGARPIINSNAILISDNPFDVAMRDAMDACFIFDPRDRPGAQAVADILKKAMEVWEKNDIQGKGKGKQNLITHS